MKSSKTARVASYIILWLVTVALSLGIVLMMRSTAMAVSLALDVSHWALGLVEKTTIVVAFLAWVVVSMVTEPYYQAGMERGLLRRRFIKVLLWQAGVAAILVAAQVLASVYGE